MVTISMFQCKIHMFHGEIMVKSLFCILKPPYIPFSYYPIINHSIYPHCIPIWLVVLTILKNISQRDGLYCPIYEMENKIHVPNRQPAVYVLSVCVNLVFRTMGDITKISGCSNMLTSSKVPNSLAAECNPLRFPRKSVFKQLRKKQQ